jgi:hypothetical protein
MPGRQPHPFCTGEASIHHSFARETRRRGETVTMLRVASERCRDATPPTSRERSGGVSVVDTTEIRWFVSGELPRDVRRWFIGAAVAEERCDRYLLDERSDVGTKFRNGETLERKTRLETGPVVELTDGLAGVLESWRKWTPADRLVQRTATQRWIDVDKWIVKRRFSPNGAEVEVSPWQNRRPSCDVEIVAIRADETTAWSFALAAHGPSCSRLGAIRTAWSALLRAGAPTIRDLGLEAAESMGYPEWLGRR